MFVIDTNILLHAVNPDSPDHVGSLRTVEECRQGDRSWFVTWGIVYEFVRVSTHARVFPRPLDIRTATTWIGLLLGSPRSGLLVETNRHLAVLGEVAALVPRAAGNIVHDLHTATLMKEHGIVEIRTLDADFLRFPFLRVVDPLTS